MCVLGAVFVEQVVVEELTDFIWIGDRPYKSNKVKSVACMLASLGKGITELEEFYKNLSLHDQDPQRFFPFIREYSVQEQVVRFSYLDYLKPKTPESASSALFRATIETEDGESHQDIIVKFVERYNAEAHHLLANANLAPTLLYCSTEDHNPPELGGLIMVVMEYINGQTAFRRYGEEQLPQCIFNQVEEALGILHGRDFVFGDLRNPNIMITKDDHTLLIDFDWCGKHGEHTYPSTLNDARSPFTSINWHQDVKRCYVPVSRDLGKRN
jgi:serine/threonine protein kinase